MNCSADGGLLAPAASCDHIGVDQDFAKFDSKFAVARERSKFSKICGLTCEPRGFHLVSHSDSLIHSPLSPVCLLPPTAAMSGSPNKDEPPGSRRGRGGALVGGRVRLSKRLFSGRWGGETDRARSEGPDGWVGPPGRVYPQGAEICELGRSVGWSKFDQNLRSDYRDLRHQNLRSLESKS